MTRARHAICQQPVGCVIFNVTQVIKSLLDSSILELLRHMLADTLPPKWLWVATARPQYINMELQLREAAKQYILTYSCTPPPSPRGYNRPEAFTIVSLWQTSE